MQVSSSRPRARAVRLASQDGRERSEQPADTVLCFRAKHRQHYIFAGRVSEPRKSALSGVSEPHVPELVERAMDLNDEEADHARESAAGCLVAVRGIAATPMPDIFWRGFRGQSQSKIKSCEAVWFALWEALVVCRWWGWAACCVQGHSIAAGVGLHFRWGGK